MAVVDFGGTVIECLSSDEKPNKPNGWFLKELDTGLSYIRKSGSWENINLGLAFIKATKSGEVETNVNGEAHITFNTVLHDTDYGVQFGINGDSGEEELVTAYAHNLTVNGFDVITRDKNGHAIGNIKICWLAMRFYNP